MGNPGPPRANQATEDRLLGANAAPGASKDHAPARQRPPHDRPRPALAACGSADTGSAGDAENLFNRRAQQVVAAWSEGDLLERWRTAVIPAQGLTVEPDWTPAAP